MRKFACCVENSNNYSQEISLEIKFETIRLKHFFDSIFPIAEKSQAPTFGKENSCNKNKKKRTLWSCMRKLKRKFLSKTTLDGRRVRFLCFIYLLNGAYFHNATIAKCGKICPEIRNKIYILCLWPSTGVIL